MAAQSGKRPRASEYYVVPAHEPIEVVRHNPNTHSFCVLYYTVKVCSITILYFTLQFRSYRQYLDETT
jgi:hypothetical protein